ncbi:MAG: Tim44/TimA family putative adaptor protein [Bdellovibrionales bacterium]
MQIFDILIYAAIAAFLFYKLWSVLGQKNEGDGEEGARPNPFSTHESQNNDEENVMVLEGRSRPSMPSALTPYGHAPLSLAGELDSLKTVDPSFNEKKFMEGARIAFGQIVTAFAGGDLSSVDWLLGPAVKNPFEKVISGRKEKGETLENRIDQIVAADIVAAKMEGSVATLTVEFVSYQVNVIKDKAGQIVEGNPHKAEEIRDTWVFRRDMKSDNPNWQLIETHA